MRPTEHVRKHDETILSQIAEPLQELHEFSHDYEHPSCIDWERFSNRVQDLKSSTAKSGNAKFIIVEGRLAVDLHACN